MFIDKDAEQADYWADIPLRNTLEVVNPFHYRKAVDPVRIGLRPLADEGGIPSAEFLDLTVGI